MQSLPIVKYDKIYHPLYYSQTPNNFVNRIIRFSISYTVVNSEAFILIDQEQTKNTGLVLATIFSLEFSLSFCASHQPMSLYKAIKVIIYIHNKAGWQFKINSFGPIQRPNKYVSYSSLSPFWVISYEKKRNHTLTCSFTPFIMINATLSYY